MNPADPDEFSQHYQYYNNKNNEKLRLLTQAMNMKSDSNKHQNQMNNKDSFKKSEHHEKVVTSSTKAKVSEKSQKKNQTPSRYPGKMKSSKMPPKPLMLVNKEPTISGKEQDSDGNVAIKTNQIDVEIKQNEAENKCTTPTTYEYEIIQSLFSYDSQMFLELALGDNANQKVPTEENVNILDYRQYPLVTSLFDSHLKEPENLDANKSESHVISSPEASTPPPEPIVPKATRYKKVVVRLHDLQKNSKPIAPKLVSKSGPKSCSSKNSGKNSLNSIKNEDSQKALTSFTSKSSDNYTEDLSGTNNEAKVFLSTAQLNNIEDSNLALNKNSKEKGKSLAAMRPTGKNPYGAYSIAQSIDKLGIEQIQFLKLSKHLEEIQHLYPKLRINLNEKTRHLYLFGVPKQVNDAKQKLKSLIENLNVAEFKLDSYELALFIKKESIQEKLLKFIQLFFDNNDSKDAVYFCIYNVLIDREANSYKLIIYANSNDICQTLFKYIIENIRVTYKLNLDSKSLVEMIKDANEEDLWGSFYKKNYKNSIDIELERVTNNNKTSENELTGLKIDDMSGNYRLSITGFREDVDEFCIELREKFFER